MNLRENTTGPRGRLFVFEGPDDVGKTSLATMLWNHLSNHGELTELLSFPGNEPGTLGELIYRFYHDPKKFGVLAISSIAMQLMVTAAHVEVIETRIKPLINVGVNVVLDRFWWSTWVYASVEGVSPLMRDRMIEIEMQCWENIEPTMVFLVLRHGPLLEQPPNNRWNEILSLYKQLFEQQKSNVQIQLVTNEGSIADATQQVLSTFDRLN